MNKNLKKIFFASSLIVALAGMSVSCKDYDNDINKLDTRVSKLETTVQSLDKQIKAGAVISAVNTTPEGITITLTNGESFTLTNGRNGQDGAPGSVGPQGPKGDQGDQGPQGPQGPKGDNGSSSVVTAGNDGFWYINGEKTNYPWKGQNGKTIYYKPGMGDNAGKWVKVTEGENSETSEEVTNMSVFAPGTLTAVWNKEKGTLTIFNADGADPNGIEIGLTGKLTSIVYAGNTLYTTIDAFKLNTFIDKTDNEIKDKNTKNETVNSVPATKPEMIYSGAVLNFFLNPSNVNSDDYSYKVLTTLYNTRADGYDNVTISKSYNYYDKVKERNVLKVIISDVKNLVDTTDQVDLFNLVATQKSTLNSEKAKQESVISDQFAFMPKFYIEPEDYSIICPADCKDSLVARFYKDDSNPQYMPHGEKGEFYVYRHKIGSNDATATLKDKAIWNANSAEKPYDDCDAAVDYNGTINLSEVVQLGSREIDGKADLLDSDILANLKESGNLMYKFELVENYNGTDAAGDATSQYSNCATVTEDGIFTPDGKPESIGKTPVVRVCAYMKDKLITCAYIKVLIATHPEPFKELRSEVMSGDINFACNNASFEVKATKANLKVALYDKVKMTPDEFNTKFNLVANNSTVTNTLANGMLTATIPSDTVYNKAPQYVQTLHYTLNNPPKSGGVIKDVYLTVKTNINNVEKSKDLTSMDLLENFWADGVTSFNVAVPAENERDNTKCIFVNNLNVPFKTWTSDDTGHTAGQIKLSSIVTKVKYSFDKEILKHVDSYGDLMPKFEMSSDSLELFCTLGENGTKTKIATINNEGTTPETLNTVTLEKNEVTEKLLNSNKLMIYYNIKGYVCGDDAKVFTVTINNMKSFPVKYIRPINVKDISDSHFTDGLDKDSKGTYIRFEDLLAPVDWRGYDFKTNENYWDYYGPFKILIDKKNIKCNLGGENVTLPSNIIVNVEEGKKTKGSGADAVTSKYGFLTYFNNGNKVTQNFELYVPVTIKYGWGEITETVTVTVMKTVENGE